MMNTRVLSSFTLSIFLMLSALKSIKYCFQGLHQWNFLLFPISQTLKKGTVVEKPPLYSSFPIGNNEKNMGSTRKSAAPQT